MTSLLRRVGLVLAVSCLAMCANDCGGTSPPAPPAPIGGGTATISGTIVDASDTTQGVTDAYVYLPSGASASAAARQTANVAEDRSGNGGSYQLKDVPGGTFTIVVEPPAGSGFSRLEFSLEVADGASITLRITLVAGTVVDTISSVIVDPQNQTVEPTETLQYSATVFTKTGESRTDLAPIWSVTNGAGTIDETGLFTAGSEAKSGTVVAIVAGFAGSTPVTVQQSGNQPPTVSINVTPTSGDAPLEVTSAVVASDTDGQIASVQVDWGDGSAPDTSTESPFSPTHQYAAVGNYTAVATATDDSGGQSQAVAAVQAKDPATQGDPPELLVWPSSLDFGSDKTSLGLSIFNNGGGTLTWSVATGDSWLSVSPSWGTDTGTVTVQADRSAVARGTHTGTVSITSNGGDDTVAVAITAANHAPTFSSLVADPAGVRPTGTSTITATVADVDQDALTYAWSASGGSISGSGSTATWTAPSAEGQYSIGCSVDDGNGGSASETIAAMVSMDRSGLKVTVD